MCLSNWSEQSLVRRSAVKADPVYFALAQDGYPAQHFSITAQLGDSISQLLRSWGC